MAVLPVISPRAVGQPGIDSPSYRSFSLAPAAAFREGDFVRQPTVGTVTGNTPAPTGGLFTGGFVGPTFSGVASINSTAAIVSGAVTITGVATASAPAATYYNVLTYTAAGTESQIGAEFIVSCAAGFTYSVNVASAGSPTGSTNFAVYVSQYEGGEVLQQASRTTTALGAAFTVAISGSLVNSIGTNRCLSSSSTLIQGIALHDSAALYALGAGGSFTAGNIPNLLGAWMPPPTLGPIDPSQALVVSLLNNQPFEISLVQPWNNALIGSAVGITLQSNGYFAADTTATAFGVIQSKSVGVPSDVGGVGDTFSRVVCIATSGVI